jgi:F0F1-type ATP synthase assembly protein I
MVADRGPNNPDGKSGPFFEKAAKAFQENITRAGPVAAASYTLIGAIILLGGIGYAIDRWRGTSPWFLLGGLLLGIVVGFYELAKAVWPKS